jgi:hypothetical protein
MVTSFSGRRKGGSKLTLTQVHRPGVVLGQNQPREFEYQVGFPVSALAVAQFLKKRPFGPVPDWAELCCLPQLGWKSEAVQIRLFSNHS